MSFGKPGLDALVHNAPRRINPDDIRLLRNNVLVQIDKDDREEQLPGSVLFKPASVKAKRLLNGIVLRAGPGREEFHFKADGGCGGFHFADMPVKVGDAVIFEHGEGTLITVGGLDCVILEDKQITAIIEK